MTTDEFDCIATHDEDGACLHVSADGTGVPGEWRCSVCGEVYESKIGDVTYWTVDPVVTTGSTAIAGPWMPGTDPHDPRIRRFSELLREQVPDDDRTPAEWQDVFAAIWRQVDEEVSGATIQS